MRVSFSLFVADYRFTVWVSYDNTTYVPDFSLGPAGGSHNMEHELYAHTGDTGNNWYKFENANVAADPANAQTVAALLAQVQAGPNLVHPASPGQGQDQL